MGKSLTHARFNRRYLTRLGLLVSSLVFAAALGHAVWRAAAAPEGVISGTVFQDYNANGARDTTATINNNGGGTTPVAVDRGIAGVTVTIYNTQGGTAGSGITDAQGSYSINASGTGPYRVEFSGFPTGYQPGPVGTDSKTLVQFVDSNAASNISLGLVLPREFCQNNPTLVTGCYVGGDQNSASPVLVSYPFSAGTTRDSGGSPFSDFDVPGPGAEATAQQVGTTWGLAYARNARQLYAAAFMKKHTGFGPGGTGAIYKVDRTSPGAVTPFADLNALLGANVAGVNPHNPGDYDRDNGDASWDAVGKVALGGLAISDDETRLYTINLAARQLIELPLNAAPTVANIRTKAIPTNPPGCTSASDVRPFAVKYYEGQLYVGMVCSAESTITAASPAGDQSKLQAYVYAVSPATLDFPASPIFQTALNYPRRCTDSAQLGPGNCFSAAWRAWSPTYRNIGTDQRGIWPQPILTDIEFDRGNLILNLRDRAGDQFGVEVLDNPADNIRYYGVTAGDVLRACGNPVTGWMLEANGRCGGQGNGPQNTGEGPGNGEYYFRDFSPPYSDEVAMGGALQLPGFTTLAVNVFDPIPLADPDTLFDGGTAWFDNATGGRAKSYRVYNGARAFGGPFGKANGLSDLVALCDAAPIEIGNRIWQDTNGNGIQDAGELGITGVQVVLFKNGQQVGTAITNGRGEFYFNGANVSGGLLANMAYEIRVDKTQGVLAGYTLTGADKDSSSGGDGRDSDAVMSGNTAIIALTTGGAGESNHSFDIGFIQPGGALMLTCPANVTATATSATGAVVTYATPTATGANATVSCTPPSGSTFPIGTTQVTCTATNAAGVATCGFTVMIGPPPPPVITCPPNQAASSSNPAGVVVNYPLPTVSPAGATVTCTPASGTTFPVGVTTVNCTASNGVTTTSCSFTVTVNVTPPVPPSLTCPVNVATTATSATGAVVTYPTPTASGGATVTCTPASGSTFPVGTTAVTCTATGATGTASCSFNVAVAAMMMKSPKCDTLCFRAPQYYLLNLDNLPTGNVLIGGVNNNQPVNTNNGAAAITIALRGNALGVGALTPLQRLNQEFIAAQLSVNHSGGGGSPVTYNAMWAMLSCYRNDFVPVTLSNGFALSSASFLNDLFEQTRAAIRENRTADYLALARYFDLLNGNDPLGRCGRQ